ncbi:GTP cyclohydrolase II [Kordiimonas sp. SCSIO 12610]|uniref:GTP cyclohydrolase II n=1 Tax=Kordiimonas sp. SCSIO 12610 TaxID=2829597 RepID=UPI00210B57F4|nr:GTP cyclohydrolase II [Kordiimonas sp. SCSIO 12610]UTW55453.1 GTP cyclohydrolase II [Kordiimonas sp. SCSIO 12610]
MHHKAQISLSIERAADDLRRGYPVILTTGHDDQARKYAIMPLELVNETSLNAFDTSFNNSFLLITDNRAATIKVAHKGSEAVRLTRSKWLSSGDLIALADPSADLSSPLKGPFSRLDSLDPDMDKAAIKLVKFARLLPALLVAECLDTEVGFSITLNTYDILNTDIGDSSKLMQVAAANIPLEGAAKTKFVAFRPVAGGLEHIAIIIGDFDRNSSVLMRIHSECFTGDLLGSLKCDCGDQLKGAIKAIDQAGGGIVLYLAQEGRGIGLISKLKAYSLQDQGYDTVDANTRLGFDVDERVYAPAAEMLRALHVKTVRLMTNNPNKIEALERFGIEVSERVAHKFPTNPHNHQYLEIKKSRTGHLL